MMLVLAWVSRKGVVGKRELDQIQRQAEEVLATPPTKENMMEYIALWLTYAALVKFNEYRGWAALEKLAA
jgi:hypothetical protein